MSAVDDARRDELRARGELAGQVGRLTHYVQELVALAQVRDEVSCDYLRQQLSRLADQASRSGPVSELLREADVASGISDVVERHRSHAAIEADARAARRRR